LLNNKDGIFTKYNADLRAVQQPYEFCDGCFYDVHESLTVIVSNVYLCYVSFAVFVSWSWHCWSWL